MPLDESGQIGYIFLHKDEQKYCMDLAEWTKIKPDTDLGFFILKMG